MNRRIAAIGVAAAAGLGFVGWSLTGPADAAPGTDGPGGIHKSYVCKWVGKPGSGTEVLQTGQNPIWVDNNSLTGKDTTDVKVGDTFSDAQGFSVVIVANTGKLNPEPGLGDCGVLPTSPPPTITNSEPPPGS
jgi:hypothetical protein